jgi:hypothetical protein
MAINVSEERVASIFRVEVKLLFGISTVALLDTQAMQRA